MKLDKEQLSKLNKTRGQILEALAYEKGLYSVKKVGKRLKERGINLGEANIRYHLKGLIEINLVTRIAATKATKRAKDLDPGARFFYKINSEYIGFYFTYFPKEAEYIEQEIPEGNHSLLEISNYHVLNKEGDVIVSEFSIFENTRDAPIEDAKHWIYTDEGFLTFDELELEVFDEDGNKLKFEQIGAEGRKEVDFKIYFKPIKKGEVYSYWLKRKRNRAFPIGIQHIYFDTILNPTELLVISITLQEEIKDIKKMKGFFKTKKIAERQETRIKPFSYVVDKRIKILWYVREPVVGSTYTLEWEPKV